MISSEPHSQFSVGESASTSGKEFGNLLRALPKRIEELCYQTYRLWLLHDPKTSWRLDWEQNRLHVSFFKPKLLLHYSSLTERKTLFSSYHRSENNVMQNTAEEQCIRKSVLLCVTLKCILSKNSFEGPKQHLLNKLRKMSWRFQNALLFYLLSFQQKHKHLPFLSRLQTEGLMHTMNRTSEVQYYSWGPAYRGVKYRVTNADRAATKRLCSEATVYPFPVFNLNAEQYLLSNKLISKSCWSPAQILVPAGARPLAKPRSSDKDCPKTPDVDGHVVAMLANTRTPSLCSFAEPLAAL